MSPWPNLTGMTNILLQFIALAQVVSVYMLEGGTVSASSLQMLKQFQMIKNTAWGDRAWEIILKWETYKRKKKEKGIKTIKVNSKPLNYLNYPLFSIMIWDFLHIKLLPCHKPCSADWTISGKGLETQMQPHPVTSQSTHQSNGTIQQIQYCTYIQLSTLPYSCASTVNRPNVHNK